MSYNIPKAIKKCKAEIEFYKDQIVEFVKLKNDYETGIRDMAKDYPYWRHFFHRTPMDWIKFRIDVATAELKEREQKLKELYKEQAWYEHEYFRNMYEDEIRETINHDGYIIGIKL